MKTSGAFFLREIWSDVYGILFIREKCESVNPFHGKTWILILIIFTEF